MREKYGYACAAFDGQREHLYGNDEGGWTNLEGNGLTLFPTIQDSRAAQRGLLASRRFIRVRLARIHLRIAQTERDLLLLARKQSLVVIQGIDTGDDQLIFGSPCDAVGSRRCFDTALPFCENGFTPFRSFAEAEECAEQIARQSCTPARPAWIKIIWLK